MIIADVFLFRSLGEPILAKVRHRLPIGHVESPQFCGVAGRFDDDIEIDFIISNCGMAFIGNGETVVIRCSLCVPPTRTSELDLITLSRHPNGSAAVMSLLRVRISFSVTCFFFLRRSLQLSAMHKSDLRTRRINYDPSHIWLHPSEDGLKCSLSFAFRIGKFILT